jgi:hypothetical protein
VSSPLKERARGFHFCTALFPIRVFGPHWVVYTLAGGDLPIEFVTERMFCDELSGTSCFGSFSSFDERFGEFFTLCDTLKCIELAALAKNLIWPLREAANRRSET